MKGILWKWTNYWMGWQPRWFILSDGVLSYYKSEDEVTQGCKGSVSLTACDISAHATDNLRLDIVIPGEKHIYVKAASTQERQQWLVALGTAKSQGAGADSRIRKISDSATTQDLIKSKKSELRLYCDLLMQQVHSIKQAATAESGPDIPKLDESTSLLSATCETFIKTLDDCVRITNAASQYGQAASTQLIPVIPNGNMNKNASNANGSREKLRLQSHSSSSSQDLN